MDHPSLINEVSPFTSANGSSCGMADIWPFPLTVSGVAGRSGGVLGARRVLSRQNLGGFGDIGYRNRDVSVDESTVTDQSRRSGGGGRKKRQDTAASEDESSKLVSTSSGNDMNNKDAKRLKGLGSGDETGDSKQGAEVSSGTGNKPAKQNTQPSELPKQDYIHVRARRGQATDSHSLAERARREKISERMKILQDLVPGCNKVIGKALILDEIINYIQSLQHQVELMSMKLEAVNSRMFPGFDGFPSKDFIAQTFDIDGMTLGSQATREYCQGSPTDWLHKQVGGSFERAP